MQAQKDGGFQFESWEEQPQFPGGKEALFSYIDSILHYPREAIDKKIEGRVITNFIVEKNGFVTDVRVIRGVDSLLDNEAKCVINSMPRWTPATQNGNIVRVRFILPIVFRLNEEGEPMSYKEAMEKERYKRKKSDRTMWNSVSCFLGQISTYLAKMFISGYLSESYYVQQLPVISCNTVFERVWHPRREQRGDRAYGCSCYVDITIYRRVNPHLCTRLPHRSLYSLC